VTSLHVPGRRVASLLVAAATVAGLAAAPLAGAQRDSVVDMAHLRLRVATTSDWTQVHLGPGTVQAVRLMSRTGTASYRPTGDGVALSGVAGGASVTVDLVFSDLDASPRYTLRTWKGFTGRTVVTVSNLNDGTAVPVGGYVDEVHSLTDGRNESTAVIGHDALMTTEPLRMPHGDSRRLVLAFYYPWFSHYASRALADRPVEPRSVWSPPDVRDMTVQAARHGVDGFVVSYAGDDRDGAAFDTAVAAAQRTGQLITGYLETARATSVTSRGAADPAVVLRWLTQLLQRRSSPAFLKAPDGRPVVFVYGMSRLSPRSWQMILDNLRSTTGGPVHLVGDALGWSYLTHEWGVHRYDVLGRADGLTRWSKSTALLTRAWSIVDPAIRPRVYVGTVSPGFDDTRLRGDTHPVVDRAGGARYDATWAAALAGSPDWVVVTSWNEWFEDTQIEPGEATGRGALEQTADHAARFSATR
jgi:hypothetical protein